MGTLSSALVPESPSPREAEAAPTQRMWDDKIWKDLLAYIEERNVIPIIGADLVRVEVGGRTMTFEQHAAEALAAQLQISLDELPRPLCLNDVVCRHICGGGERGTLYREIRDIVRGEQLAPPPALVKLASITDFNLFVSTTFDSLLESAINEARFSARDETRSVGYTPDKRPDIETGQRRSGIPLVYHLLGLPAARPNTYVISDEDLLEFICALQTSEYRPKNLFDELAENNLLFLGGAFPDWLSRLLLRTTKGVALSGGDHPIEILADSRTRGDRALVRFLETYSKHTKVFSSDANAFIDELWRRWSEMSHTARSAAAREQPPPPEMPEKAIFISYASEDLEAVKRLKSRLEEAGLVVWFDKADLKGGDAYSRKIARNIQRCLLFMPVLSRNTEHRIQGYFRGEWNLAIERAKSIAESVPFIAPVVVDDVDPYDFKYVPDKFLERHIMAARNGEADPEDVKGLKSQVETLKSLMG
jgi:hypothetical protein